MNYELAKQLKEAGFVLRDSEGLPIGAVRPGNAAFEPTLEELIEACKDKHPDWWFELFCNGITGKWVARFAQYPSSNPKNGNIIYLEVGITLIETIAKLWLALNTKPKEV